MLFALLQHKFSICGFGSFQTTKWVKHDNSLGEKNSDKQKYDLKCYILELFACKYDLKVNFLFLISDEWNPVNNEVRVYL